VKLKKLITCIALRGLICALFVLGLGNGTQEAVAKENPAVTFPDYEIGLFSHKAHVTGAGLQCNDCHTKIFEMSASNAQASGDFNKISFGEGKYCGACHNGSVVFGVQDEASCKRCHSNDVNPPDTIFLKQPINSIPFDHSLHTKELGLACNECHMKLFDMKTGSTGEKDDFTMEAMYDGKYCGACHNGNLAFGMKGDCTKCHVDTTVYEKATSESEAKEGAEQ
jgi:c(7)-type cytochrome triheme protein